MHTTETAKSKHCLHSANNAGDQNRTSTALPRAKAWRIGIGLVVVECPICKGIHRHGEPDDGEIESRVGHCEQVFADAEMGDEYEIHVRPDLPPHQIGRAIKQDLPLNDLAVAFAKITGGSSIAEWRSPRNGRDQDEPEWIPDLADVRFALGALRRCGGLDEAHAMRAELGKLGGTSAWRLAASDVWRRAPGRRWRNRLLWMLRSCWAQHGGPL